MTKSLPAPRQELSPNAPRILTVRIPVDKIGTIIGPGGKQIRELEALGAQIDIAEDGLVSIYSADSAAAEQVRTTIAGMTSSAEVGMIYEGTVAKIVDFGAFITLFPGTDGLLHISQIAQGRVNRVEDHLKIGDKIKVKVNKVDERGKLDLIRPELEGIVPPRKPPAPRGDRREERGGRR